MPIVHFMIYPINAEMLRELIESRGDYGFEIVSASAMVSSTTLRAMCAKKYKSVPRKALRSRLSAYFDVAETDLFPVVRKGSVQAS